MKKMNTVIFDLDGTLLDTLEDLYRSVNAALTTCGLPLRTLDEVRQFVGNGVHNLICSAVPGGEDDPHFEDCFLAFREHYAKHMNDHTKPYDGIMELLQELSDRGVKTAIVSNKGDAAVKELNRTLFNDRISVAIGEREGVRRKPAPDTVYEAIRELGSEREKSVYIGDSEVDLETARNAGLPCIAVSWGFRERALLERLGAEEIADTPAELLKMLNTRLEI